ncbi:MAG: hypothetical protein L0H31_05500 [Nocardioidaceae bacterium]|nr:hypothetical protein [Nocardioidaceae bacterium]
MERMRGIFFDEEHARTAALTLARGGYQAEVVRERLAGEDDDEDHPWAVLTDAPEIELDLLVEMYDGGLDVEVSEATILDTEVSDGFGQDVMTLHGTVEEAYLSPFINAGVDYGGNLDWAGEDEIHLVVPLAWDRDYSTNVEEHTEVVLELPDGTELRPAQDQSTMFRSGHVQPIATFTIPAALDTATVRIMPRFGQVLDEDFEQVEEPVTATLTFA